LTGPDSTDQHHAVVTGGGSGVGAAIARELAEAGMAVTILGRGIEQLEAVSAGHPSITSHVGDVTDRAALEAAIDDARARSGPVDVMVASAGISGSKPFHRLTGDDLAEMMSVNVTGVFNSFQVALDDMRHRDRGRLIAIASTAGLTGYPYVSHYCASKHAVVGMVRAVAQELGSSGTTVNAVCPSYVETPMTDRTIDNIVAQTGRTREEALAALVAANPQRRLITPSEVAGTVAWLCSDAAAAVNGQAIAIDGGEL